MVLAAVGAAAVGQVLDGGLLIVIFATSGALEAVATHRTAQAVRGLLDLAPDQATRLDEAGGEQVVDAAGLRVGDVILVRPGERIAADGQVLSGASDVDQATITGEPLPAPRARATRCSPAPATAPGALRVRVSRAASDTVVARIVAMVGAGLRDQGQDAAVHREGRAALLARHGHRDPAAARGPAGSRAPRSSPTLLRAMTFMIVASPCAVVLATMPPLLAAMANAGRHGVLVKSAVVMERLGATTLVAFDKTGTLTEGTPRLTGITVLPGAGLGEREVLALAAAAEAPSEHPLGRAVTAAARDAGLAPRPSGGVHRRPRPRASPPWSPAAASRSAARRTCSAAQRARGRRRARRGAGRRRADRRSDAGGRDRGRAAGHRGPHPPGRRVRPSPGSPR